MSCSCVFSGHERHPRQDTFQVTLESYPGRTLDRIAGASREFANAIRSLSEDEYVAILFWPCYRRLSRPHSSARVFLIPSRRADNVSCIRPMARSHSCRDFCKQNASLSSALGEAQSEMRVIVGRCRRPNWIAGFGIMSPCLACEDLGDVFHVPLSLRIGRRGWARSTRNRSRQRPCCERRKVRIGRLPRKRRRQRLLSLLCLTSRSLNRSYSKPWV